MTKFLLVGSLLTSFRHYSNFERGVMERSVMERGVMERGPFREGV